MKSIREQLLARLRAAFKGQVSGLLDAVPATAEVLAHHSFHVFVVYPWVRFLRRDAATALRVMQDCRIRWGTVESVAGEHAVISSSPLQLDDDRLILGDSQTETRPMEERRPVAGTRPDARVDRLRTLGLGVRNPRRRPRAAALQSATRATLDLVNATAPKALPLRRDRSTLVF